MKTPSSLLRCRDDEEILAMPSPVDLYAALKTLAHYDQDSVSQSVRTSLRNDDMVKNLGNAKSSADLSEFSPLKETTSIIVAPGIFSIIF